ncbi:MAG: THUMP-like domain-containing protein [Phycisphaerae bacterium]
MSLTLDQLEFLRSEQGRSLLETDWPDDPLAAIQRLRKKCDAGQASAVLTIRDLRCSAVGSGRFPKRLAENILCTDTLLQQASSTRLAVWKGRRICESAGGKPVLDLCSGLGADAIGIASAGCEVHLVDRSGEALLCAEHNSELMGVADRCRFVQSDVEALDLPADAVVHVDPDRRASGRRRVDLADYVPGPAFLRSLLERTRAGVMKLSPALPFSELEHWPGLGLEYVSEGGTCKQLLGWWGPGVRQEVVATVVSGEHESPVGESIRRNPNSYPTIAAPGAYLIEPGPAVLAADAVDDLAERFGLWRIEPNLVWLFGDEPPQTQLARSFRVLQQVPGREQDIKRALRKLQAGVVEVKPRGVRMNTDKMQMRLRGKGRRPLAVLWGRLGRSEQAFIAERV